MPEIDSPLGPRKFKQTMKEIDIEDASEDASSFEEELRQHRELRRNPEKERMSPVSKDRINYLLGLTRMTKEFEVNDVKFLLRTLKSSENRESVAKSSKFLGTPELDFEIRKQFLARSLQSIHGMNFDDFIGSSNLEDKLKFIDSLDEGLANIMYLKFQELVKEANEKYSLNKESVAKEVVDDLKK